MLSFFSLPRHIAGARSAITKILVDSRKRVVAGCVDGSTLVWNVDVVAILATVRNMNGYRQVYEGDDAEEQTYSKYPDIGIVPPSTEVGVKNVLYDGKLDFMIVHYSGCARIYKYSAINGQCLAVFENPDSTANITCIQWDKEVSSGTEEESSTPGTPSWKQSRHQQDIIAASNFPVITNTESFPSSTIRVLASGDENGNVCLFNIDSTSTSSKPILPLTSIQGHYTAISAIFLDACKLVTGR